MGFFDAIGKLISGEEINFSSTTTTNAAASLLTGERQNYIGEWTNENVRLLIKPDGTIEYRRVEVVGDSTNTDSVNGPISGFDGASFNVGIMGNDTRFEIAAPPSGEMLVVNGEQLHKVA